LLNSKKCRAGNRKCRKVQENAGQAIGRCRKDAGKL